MNGFTRIGNLGITWGSYFRCPCLWEWSWHKVKTLFESWTGRNSDGPFVPGFRFETGPVHVGIYYPIPKETQP